MVPEESISRGGKCTPGDGTLTPLASFRAQPEAVMHAGSGTMRSLQSKRAHVSFLPFLQPQGLTVQSGFGACGLSCYLGAALKKTLWLSCTLKISWRGIFQAVNGSDFGTHAYDG